MLSRVQCLEQINILGSLDESKIRTSLIGLNELKRLKSKSINENPSAWNTIVIHDTIKVASLNCAGLSSHFIDINADEKLKKADIIHLMETSLEEDEGQHLTLPGYKSHFINIGKGKGIVTYFKEMLFSHEEDFAAANMQITKFNSNQVDVINVYRSYNGNSVELLNHITEMMRPNKPLLLTGDFNICMLSHGHNRMSKGLIKSGFKQMIREATHTRGGHIDHVYWLDEHGVWNYPELELYCPYYSDHDASLITLTTRK